MATPVLTRRTLPGALGDILIDVHGAKGAAASPAVLIVNGFKDREMFPGTAERLARAGFAIISLDAGPNTFNGELADLERVITALDQGRLGVPRPTSIGLLSHGRASDVEILAASRLPRIGALVTWGAGGLVDFKAAAAAKAPARLFPDGERALDATTAWFSRHLP